MGRSSYAGIVDELQRRAALRRQPASGIFELTPRCNLACRMCYIRQAAGDVAARARELTATEWISLAEEAVDNGLVFLLLTGGEVFVRPDFFQLYMPLTRLGLVITLFTNGTLVTEAVATQLAMAPPSRTEITLYGATAETYEGLTGVPGSYKRCCDGIEALINAGVPLSLKTTLTRQNVSELPAMRQMAQNWGLPFSAGYLLSKRRDGESSEIAACRLPVSDCVDLEMTYAATPVDSIESDLRDSPSAESRLFNCRAGESAFAVNAFGEMNVCLDLQQPAARPLESSFRAAWQQVQAFVDTAPSLPSLCLGCEARIYCSHCPAFSYQETTTLNQPVPYLCEMAHALAALNPMAAG